MIFPLPPAFLTSFSPPSSLITLFQLHWLAVPCTHQASFFFKVFTIAGLCLEYVSQILSQLTSLPLPLGPNVTLSVTLSLATRCKRATPHLAVSCLPYSALSFCF